MNTINDRMFSCSCNHNIVEAKTLHCSEYRSESSLCWVFAFLVSFFIGSKNCIEKYLFGGFLSHSFRLPHQ